MIVSAIGKWGVSDIGTLRFRTPASAGAGHSEELARSSGSEPSMRSRTSPGRRLQLSKRGGRNRPDMSVLRCRWSNLGRISGAARRAGNRRGWIDSRGARGAGVRYRAKISPRQLAPQERPVANLVHGVGFWATSGLRRASGQGVPLERRRLSFPVGLMRFGRAHASSTMGWPVPGTGCAPRCARSGRHGDGLRRHAEVVS